MAFYTLFSTWILMEEKRGQGREVDLGFAHVKVVVEIMGASRGCLERKKGGD